MKNKFGKVFAAAVIAAAVAGGVGAAVTAPGGVNAEETAQDYFRTVETDAQGWTWNGFSPVENGSASRLWQHCTYEAGAVGEYKFKGSAVELVGYRGPDGGRLQVEIDGVAQTEVSLNAASESYKQTLASYEVTGEGWHTVKITSAEEGKWHALDCVRIAMDRDAYLKNYNLALVGNIICSVENPTGGGNKDLNVIRNEKIYPVGTTGTGPMQYDSFNGGGRGMFYMGYSFKEHIPFSKLVFQEGDTWDSGGWFSDGDIKVQVRTINGWKDVELTSPVAYPVSDKREDFGDSCEIYTFEFETVTGDAIRLIGMNGGTDNFVSVSQIEVYSDADAVTLSQGYDYRTATVYEQKPTDGGKKPQKNGESDSNIGLVVGLSVGGAALIGGGAAAAFVVRKKKKGA